MNNLSGSSKTLASKTLGWYLRSALVVLTFVCTLNTQAATINWGNTFEVATESDIITTNGTFHYGVNAGDDRRSSQTYNINGTSLNLEDVAYNPDTKLNGPADDNAFFGIIDSHRPGDANNVTFDTTGARNVPALNGGDGLANITWDYGYLGGLFLGNRVYQQPTGNSDLDTVLNSAIFTDGRQNFGASLDISLHNLTPGRDYQVQLVSYADTRTGKLERDWTFYVNDGTVSNPLDSEFGFATYQDLDGDGERHVTSILGLFTADNADQLIEIGLEGGRNPGISLLTVYDVTAVPVPAAAGFYLVSLALALLAAVRRSRV